MLLTSQTGTGKTTYILKQLLESMEENGKLIYICNRIELARDIKLKIIKKKALALPESQEDLDRIS